MRIISAAQTKQQIIAETKTVTRRLGWLNLKVGELLQVVEKAQGLKKGEKMKRLKVIRVTEVHREPLNAITQAEVIAEGFPGMTSDEFIAFFCKGHKGCTLTTEVTVIHFEYYTRETLSDDDTGDYACPKCRAMVKGHDTPEKLLCSQCGCTLIDFINPQKLNPVGLCEFAL